jgi:hypothetical protein
MSIELRALAVAVATALVASCSSDNNPDSVFLEGASVTGGVWTGTTSPQGEEIFGIVAEDGSFHFVASIGGAPVRQYFGSIAAAGNLFNGTIAGVSSVGGADVCPGFSAAEGTIPSGSVRRRSSLSFVSQLVCGTTVSVSDFALSYSSRYERSASNATVAGNYTNSANGAAVTVFPTGAIFSQEPATGCVINGLITPVSPRFNAYDISVTYEQCTSGPFAGSVPITLSGLATLDGTDLVASLVSGTSTTTSAGGIVLVLNRT